MEFRYLGRSGFRVSAVSYGNWVTHGSQVEADRDAGLKRRPDAGRRLVGRASPKERIT